MAPGPEPITPSETVYRRIAPGYYPDPAQPTRPQWIAFRPRDPNPTNAEDKGDADGLSVDRAKYTTPARTSVGFDPQKPYHVAGVTVEQVRSVKDSSGTGGMDVLAAPIAANDAHAIIPQLNCIDCRASSRAKARIKEWAMQLAELANMVLVLPK